MLDQTVRSELGNQTKNNKNALNNKLYK